MADLRAKFISEELIDRLSRAQYLTDMVEQAGSPVAKGDTFQVGYLSDLTVTADGATTTSAQSITSNALTLTVDDHPTIFAKLPKVDQVQLLNGKWASGVARDALNKLKNYMDQEFCKYLASSVAYDSSATYHDNVAADALLRNEMIAAIAKMMSNDGISKSDLVLFMHPFGHAAIQALGDYRINAAPAASEAIGLPVVGHFMGIPIVESNSVSSQRTVSASASAISSNVMTITVAAGHGVVPGMFITTAGGTANVTTAAAVTSVGATSIVVPKTASNDAANGALTVTIQGAENLLLDRSKCWFAQQLAPSVEIVKYTGNTGHELQVSSLTGQLGMAGRVRVIMTSASAIV